MNRTPEFDRRACVVDLSAYRALRNKQALEQEQGILFQYDAALAAEYINQEEGF